MATGHRDTARDRRERRERRADSEGSNTAIDRAKQAAALLVGGALLVRGLRRRSFRGIATALLGGWLLSRGLGGRPGVERTIRTATETVGADERSGPVKISRAVTIDRPADELYEAVRTPEKLSRIVGNGVVVVPAGERRLRWSVPGPQGRDLAGEVRIVEDEPGEYLRWESTPDALLSHEGSLRFRDAPDERGTIVTLSIGVEMPGGELGAAVLRRLDVLPAALAGAALDRFKSLAETGEIPTIERNPSGRGEGDRL